MDNSAERGSPGDLSNEIVGSLDERYKALNGSVATLYRLTTPPEEPRGFLRRAREARFRRVKDTRATDTITHIKDVFSTRFSDSFEQAQVIDAADNYLHKLATSIDPNEELQDENISDFISSFPDNIIVQLGEYSSADIVSRIFRMGSSAIDVHMREVAVTSSKIQLDWPDFVNGPLGYISKGLTKELPQAIRNAGKTHETLLVKLEKAAKESDIKFGLMEKFYSEGFYEPSSATREHIARLRTLFEETNPDSDTPSSPFNRTDREPWENETVMGHEKRAPTWNDVIDMVASTEEDDIEYGLTATKSDDEIKRTDYIRGDREHISKKGQSPGGVFFHAHPSHSTLSAPESWNEFCAPIVSVADIKGSDRDDGSGFYNVGTMNGITFHTGIEKTSVISSPISEGNRKYIHTIESGEQRGKSFTSNEGHDAQTLEIMKHIKEAGKPFLYSTYKPTSQERHYFIHIPWDAIHSNRDITFEQVLYENGLRELVGRLDNIPQVPVAPNVLEGLTLAA